MPVKNNAIRIFVDAHAFDGEYQGVTTYIKGLYTEISRLCPETQICMGANNIENLKKEFKGLINITFAEYSSRKRTRYLLAIPLIIKNFKADYAHFQYVCPPFKSCKYIVTIHDLLFNDFPKEFSFFYRTLRNYSFKSAAKKADILTTVSEYSRESISKHYGILKNKILVVPDGVDERFFESYNKDLSKKKIFDKHNVKKYILYVSRIEPRKNHDFLLKAYLDLELWKKDISLVFVGKKTIKNDEFSTLISNLPSMVKKKIMIIEQASWDDLLDFYRGADLFVYPSKAEGFGIPPIEAAALGIQTLCSNTTAMSDFGFLEKGLFDPSNLSELKEKILFALDGKLYSDDVILSISKIVKDKYCWSSAAKKLLKAMGVE